MITPTLRDRAEHAARYDANLVVPARDILHLLDELRSTEGVLTYTRETTRLATEAAERAEAANEALREQIGIEVRAKDEWEANAETAIAIAARVRAEALRDAAQRIDLTNYPPEYGYVNAGAAAAHWLHDDADRIDSETDR